MNRIIITFLAVFNLKKIACVNSKDIKEEISESVVNNQICEIAFKVLDHYHPTLQITFTSENLLNLIQKYLEEIYSETNFEKFFLENKNKYLIYGNFIDIISICTKLYIEKICSKILQKEEELKNALRQINEDVNCQNMILDETQSLNLQLTTKAETDLLRLEICVCEQIRIYIKNKRTIIFKKISENQEVRTKIRLCILYSVYLFNSLILKLTNVNSVALKIGFFVAKKFQMLRAAYPADVLIVNLTKFLRTLQF